MEAQCIQIVDPAANIPQSHVAATCVRAYAFSIPTTGAASARQDVPGSRRNPPGLSLLLPGAAANKQSTQWMYWPDSVSREHTV